MPSIGRDKRFSQPCRVLYVITDLDVGGAEKCCAQLATGLDRSRWTARVCCLSRNGAIANQLIKAGIPVHALGAGRYWETPRATLKLARLISQFRPALVHTFLFHANVLGRLAARLAGVPRVLSSIRVAERRYPSHLILENLTCRLSDRIACVSQGVAQFTQRRAHVPAGRMIVVPNGVDVHAIERAAPLGRALALPDDAVTAVYVGRLDPQKGLDVLLEALAMAKDHAPQLYLLIAGSGAMKQSLVLLAQQLGIDSKTRFLGWRDDVPALLRSADLLVLPSRWEGMPNVVLEAMAAGLPVVATRTEGTTELVRHGETGLLTAIDEPADLARALVAMARDPMLRLRCGAGGRDVVRDGFSLTRMIQRYEQLYESLLA